MRYQLIAVILAALLLGSCTMWREHPAHAWSETTGGEGLEQLLWQDVKTKNWKELEQHMAGNYVAVTPQLRLNREGMLQHLNQVNLRSILSATSWSS